MKGRSGRKVPLIYLSLSKQRPDGKSASYWRNTSTFNPNSTSELHHCEKRRPQDVQPQPRLILFSSPWRGGVVGHYSWLDCGCKRIIKMKLGNAVFQPLSEIRAGMTGVELERVQLYLRLSHKPLMHRQIKNISFSLFWHLF